jgi:hypothetical protein
MKILSQIVLPACLSLVLFACGKGDHQNVNSDSGQLMFRFEHFEGENELAFDAMNYISAAGNQYEVTEIQYFISDITLNKSTGEKILVEKEKFAHYIDTNIPSTFDWEIDDDIPTGHYASISMTFGIKGEKNTPFMYTDPPESDMFWPMNLGGENGGYHYMKLNGFWMNVNNEREPFNFHLGVGQERDAENKITGFIQNWIEVDLPASSFTLEKGEKKIVTIRMNVDQWWENPNIYDHNIHGGKIMQNQNAMQMGVENARSVFEVSKVAEVADAL